MKTLRNRLTLLGTTSLFAVALVAAPVQFSSITPDLAVAQAAEGSGSGQLTGAQNVDLNGTLYDVTFVDGTCIALFSGCDALADFDFITAATATVAANALLNQVFTDTGSGSFDTEPELAFGCTSSTICGALIPFGFSAGLVTTISAFNRSPPSSDTVGGVNVQPSFNSGSTIVFADFQVTPVP